MTIDGVTYGSGTASSKKLAKNRAGKAPAGGTRPPRLEAGWATYPLTGKGSPRGRMGEANVEGLCPLGRVGPRLLPRPSMHPPTATHTVLCAA